MEAFPGGGGRGRDPHEGVGEESAEVGKVVCVG